MPWNYQLVQNQEYAANFQAVVKTARTKNTAVQIIKTAQRRLWGDNPHWSTTWYEPYKDQKSLDLAIHWALSNPGVFINSAGDVNVMPMVLDAASRYETPPTDEQMQELMKKQATEPLWV
jgi:predicted aldo/keto reductase-like oxidoreductase